MGNGGTLNFTPGVYGDIALGGGATLNLNGSGDYYFDELTAGNGLDLNITVTTGRVRVFVVGRVGFGGSDVTITGGDHRNFYLETHFSGTPQHAFASGGGTDWKGTIYAPYDSIHIGSGSGPGSVVGRLWSGTHVDLEHGLTVVPAPGVASLAGAAAGILGFRRRRTA